MAGCLNRGDISMGYRLSKIYTRTGDKGDTGMADGSRVAKDDIKVVAIGDIDELNCQIGVLISEISDRGLLDLLNRIQHILFDLGAEITLPEYEAINASHIDYLEQQLDEMNQHLKPLEEFILPGGSRSAAACHLARAVCRRAERSLVKLNREHTVNMQTLAFINRLSDLLFVMARKLCVDAGAAEIYWQKSRMEHE